MRAIERARVHVSTTLRTRAEAQAGPEEAAIFDVQLSMLDDGELLQGVEALIRQNLGAEKAFDIVLLEWRQHFARHTAPMLRERVGDLTDVHIRVLSILLDLPDHDPVDVPEGSERDSRHARPDAVSSRCSSTAKCIAAIATEAGTATAHVAILARSLGLPAVVGLRNAVRTLHGGERAILNGTEGTLLVAPTEAEVEEARLRAEADEAGATTSCARLAQAHPVTLRRRALVIRANVDIPEEVGARGEQRRRRRGTHAHRVPRGRSRGHARRGGAVPRLSSRGRRRSAAGR